MMEYTFEHGIRLLNDQRNNIRKVIEAIAYSKTGIHATEEFLETHLTNYFFQLSTYHNLLLGSQIFSPESDKLFLDFTSINVISRSLIEAYFTIHYLFFDVPSISDEAEFRYLLYSIHGLNIRQNLRKEIIPLPPIQKKLEEEKNDLDRFETMLQSNKQFLKLHEKKRKQLLRDKPARDVSLTQLVSKYFANPAFRQTWEHLSNFAHMDYQAALQLRTIFKDTKKFAELPSLLRQPLFIIVMLNSSLLTQLNKRFISAQIVFNAFPSTFINENVLWLQVATSSENDHLQF